MKKLYLIPTAFFVGVLCLMLAYLVWYWTENKINFYLSKATDGLAPIAQIKSKKNSVLRNHTGQLIWHEIDNGDLIYLGNSIQTEKKSFTEVLFDSGEKIIIGPDSLVRFTRAEDKISLQLIEGRLEVKSVDTTTQQLLRLDSAKTSPLVIKTPRGRIDLNNSNLKVQAEKNNDKNFKIEVIDGSPELTNISKKEILKPSTIRNQITVIEEPLLVSEIEKDTTFKKLDKIPEPTQDMNLPKPVVKEIATEIKSEILKETPPIEAKPIIQQLPPKIVQKEVPKIEKPEIKKVERQPAKALLSAPKIKSIKVKEVE